MGGVAHGGNGRRRDLAVIQGYVLGRLLTKVSTNPRKHRYGLTETSPTSTFLPYDDAIRKNGSCGVLLPTLEARIVDDNENDVAPGMAGELWIRSYEDLLRSSP